MIVKQIQSGDEARKKLLAGVDAMCDAVGSTLGARGRTVLIESEQHVGGITVTKDGVTVSRAINLMDPAENLAVMVIREACEKTATTAGDGTTSTAVLAQAIMHNAIKQISNQDNQTQVLRDIVIASQRVLKELDLMSVKVSPEKLLSIATISANGDETIGEIIAHAYEQVGLSGVVTVEQSKNWQTYSQIVNGMKIDRGFQSKYFVTDHQKQEVVMRKPYILVTDQEISNINDIVPILEFMHADQTRCLLIVGEVSEAVLATLNMNVVKKVFNVCTIIPPNFGYKRQQLMQDIAISTGAKYFSEATGDMLSMVSIDDLGRAEKVVSGRTNTLIFDAEGEVEARAQELQEQLTVEESEIEKEFLKERIANLGGGVAVIYVGANSDIEMKEKRDRVDDAVCAVRAALEEGVLPGGGVALKDIATSYKMVTKGDMILMRSMVAPIEKILANAGMDSQGYSDGKGMGTNVVTEQVCNMLEAGIIDPTKVVKESLKNAVSVATTLLSTNTVVTNQRAL